jgi:uncharacterized membrane protein
MTSLAGIHANDVSALSHKAAPRSGTSPRPALRRVAACGLVGLVVGLGVVLAGAPWEVAVSAGWTAAALSFLIAVCGKVLTLSPSKTKSAARVEDASRAAADTVLLAAAVASLVAVGFVLVGASNRTGAAKAGYVVLAVASVVVAWAAVHTVYALRYARMYYAEPGGGVDFHEDDPPDYRDFAYLALTIGMTFQVSDTDLTVKPIRRLAIQHALLSYLFGAVIVALMINIVGSLAG